MHRKQAITRGAIIGAATALAILAAACGTDATTSPAAATRPIGLRADRTENTASLDGAQTFTVFPNRSMSILIGKEHKLYFTADAICDPATSGYGPDTWETPCEPLRHKIQVTVRASVDSAGHPAVSFSPDLRFTPDDKKPVWLALADRQAARTTEPLRIVYCPSDESACVDESLTDPEVATQMDPRRKYLYRRIKHFSGYVVASGFTQSTAE